MSRIVLVGGGVRSGKSSFALSLARRMGDRRIFLATAQGLDAGMRARIARHVEDRGEGFVTVEEPLHVPAAVERLPETDVVVVDCLTVWIANLLLSGRSEGDVIAEVEALLRAVSARELACVIVSNEVGMGVHPETDLGLLFRDVVGRAHQLVAFSAHEIYFAVMGVLLRLRPDPVTVMTRGG